MKLIKESYAILCLRDSEFKREWEELNQYTLEQIQNSEELKLKAFNFSQKYDKTLLEIIKSLIT